MLKFGLFTFSYLFGEEGVTFSIKKETAFNVKLESSLKATNQDFFVPLEYSTEDFEVLETGIVLSDDIQAYFLSSISWNYFFPQITNLITLKSIYVYKKYFMVGDYFDGNTELRVLFEIGHGNLNVFVLEKNYLPEVLHCCDYEEDIKLEHLGNKILITNPNRNCRQYFTS